MGKCHENCCIWLISACVCVHKCMSSHVFPNVYIVVNSLKLFGQDCMMFIKYRGFKPLPRTIHLKHLFPPLTYINWGGEQRLKCHCQHQMLNNPPKTLVSKFDLHQLGWEAETQVLLPANVEYQ